MRFNSVVDLNDIDVWLNFRPYELNVLSEQVAKGLLDLVRYVEDLERKEKVISVKEKWHGELDLEIVKSLIDKLERYYQTLSTMQYVLNSTTEIAAEQLGWKEDNMALCNYGNARCPFILKVPEVIMLQRILNYASGNRKEFNQIEFWLNSTELMVNHIRKVIGERLLIAMSSMKIGV